MRPTIAGGGDYGTVKKGRGGDNNANCSDDSGGGGEDEAWRL